MSLVSKLYTAEVFRREVGKKVDKIKEQAEREEHVRKRMVEFIDQVTRELFPANAYCLFTDRDKVVDIIEKLVVKERKWI